MNIKKGEIFLCTKDLEISGIVLYVKGRTYISPANWALTDDLGDTRTGWNKGVLEDHFEKVSAGDRRLWILVALGLTAIGLMLMCSCSPARTVTTRYNAYSHYDRSAVVLRQPKHDGLNVFNSGEVVRATGKRICVDGKQYYTIINQIRR